MSKPPVDPPKKFTFVVEPTFTRPTPALRTGPVPNVKPKPKGTVLGARRK